MTAEVEAVLEQVRRAHLPIFFEVEIDNPHVQGFTGDGLLHVVANWGDVEAVRVLLDAGVEIDRPGEDGCTALHEAVGQGHPEVVRLLLERGADPYRKNEMGWDAFSNSSLRSPELLAVLEKWKRSSL